MPHLLLPVLALSAAFGAEGCVQGAPCYSEAGIVNAATSRPGNLAPGGLATLYGTGLAYSTRAVGAADLTGGTMPLELAGVSVSVDGQAAAVYYVSPGQINFVVPARLRLESVPVRVVREGRAGPQVNVALAEAAPVLFLRGDWVCGAHADGTPLSEQAPAAPGEVVILYATGLGATVFKPLQPSEIPMRAAALAKLSEFRVEAGGRLLPGGSVLYAGAAPGFLGLYQINVALPQDIGAPIDVRIGFEDRMSDPARLPVADSPP